MNLTDVLNPEHISFTGEKSLRPTREAKMVSAVNLLFQSNHKQQIEIQMFF